MVHELVHSLQGQQFKTDSWYQEMDDLDDFTYYYGFVSLMEAQSEYVEDKWTGAFDEYDRQINGFENAKSAEFETKEQSEAYLEKHEESNISPLQLVPVLEAVNEGNATTIQAKENEFIICHLIP